MIARLKKWFRRRRFKRRWKAHWCACDPPRPPTMAIHPSEFDYCLACGKEIYWRDSQGDRLAREFHSEMRRR